MSTIVSVVVSADLLDNGKRDTDFVTAQGLSQTRAFAQAIDTLQARNPFATILNPFIERVIYL